MSSVQDVEVFQKLLLISRQFAENRELQAVLDYTVDTTLDFLNAERGYLILVDEAGNLDFRVKRAIKGIDLSSPKEAISHTLLKQCLDQQKPMLVSNAMEDARLADALSVRALDLRSLMCVPLRSQGKILGVLYVENRSIENRFEQYHLELLEHLASLAAVAILNAQLNDDLEAEVAARTAELQETNRQLKAEIAERKHFESSVIRLALEHERREVLAMFIRDASHEFRTPLSVIQTNLALMERNKESTSFERYTSSAKYSIQAMVELLEKMLDMVRLDSDELQVHKPIRLNRVVQDALESQASFARASQVQLRTELTAEGSGVIGDAAEFKIALEELLKNAIKFSPPGGEVLLRTYKQDSSVVLEVIDSGVGIPDEYLPRIFERFFRVDDAHSTRGLGLGLCIVQRIVERHGGELTVESAVDIGSTFRIMLPIHTRPDTLA